MKSKAISWRQKRLRLKTRWITFGKLEPLRVALDQCSNDNQVRRRIRGLVNFTLNEMASGRFYNKSGILDMATSCLPQTIQRLPIQALMVSFDLLLITYFAEDTGQTGLENYFREFIPAIEAASRNQEELLNNLICIREITQKQNSPYCFNAIARLANSVTPEHFVEALAIASKFVNETRHPANFFWEAFPALNCYTKHSLYNRILLFAHNIASESIDPSSMLKYVIPVLIKKSEDDTLEAKLCSLEKFIKLMPSSMYFFEKTFPSGEHLYASSTIFDNLLSNYGNFLDAIKDLEHYAKQCVLEKIAPSILKLCHNAENAGKALQNLLLISLFLRTPELHPRELTENLCGILKNVQAEELNNVLERYARWLKCGTDCLHDWDGVHCRKCHGTKCQCCNGSGCTTCVCGGSGSLLFEYSDPVYSQAPSYSGEKCVCEGSNQIYCDECNGNGAFFTEGADKTGKAPRFYNEKQGRHYFVNTGSGIYSRIDEGYKRIPSKWV